MKARERFSFAERMTGEETFQRFFPDQVPDLVFFEPASSGSVEGPTIQIIGAATDDRGVARLDFRVGGKLVATQLPPPPDPGQNVRTFKFQRAFALDPGPNDITVAVVDTAGKTRSETLRLTRRLRWWEKRAFLPSAFGMAVARWGPASSPSGRGGDGPCGGVSTPTSRAPRSWTIRCSSGDKLLTGS